VPVAEDHLWLSPGVIFCLRQTGNTEGTETVNPLQPYYLVYIHETGVVRYTFSQPKQVLELLKELCSGRDNPYDRLCQLFNEHTKNGRDMTEYSTLLERAVETIIAQFNKRNLDGLFASRSAKLTPNSQRAKSAEDFELITWVVMTREPK
jgi:hypothetical protein